MIDVRPIRKGEGAALLKLVRELAHSHGVGDHVEATAEGLESALFAENPVVGCLLALVDGEVCGCAFWHRSFATFRGREVMYLEDLSVLPAYRRKGAARALLAGVAKLAREMNYPSIYWLMMGWNTAARKLYESVGAEIEENTCYCRIHGEALERLAS